VSYKNLELLQMVTDLDENGYVVFHLDDFDALADQINEDIDSLISSGNYRTNSKIYSYNDSPRVVESWKHSSAARLLAFHPQIIELIGEYFKAVPKPFSTINFVRSTEQPLHSDSIHFGTDPPFQLAAAWVALEDIDPNSGPLHVVPKSHKWPEFVYSQISLPVARSLGDVKRYYELYEDWVSEDLDKRQVQTCVPQMKKGDVLIWLANLLHGSPGCLDSSISRRSQVIHFHTDVATNFYNPVFSDPAKAKNVNRKVEFIPE